MKTREKEIAVLLRKKGYSLREIAERLVVSKGSVSLWVHDLKLPPAAVARIEALQTAGQRAAQKSKRAATQRHLDEAQTEAERLVSEMRIERDFALVLCALMYWCEGEKSRGDKTFTFSNSDPHLVRTFMALLRKSCELEAGRFRVRMHLHEYHDEESQRQFWSKVTQIPKTQFGKTYLKSHTGKTVKPGYPGCIHVSYYDVRLARKISATARAFLRHMIE